MIKVLSVALLLLVILQLQACISAAMTSANLFYDRSNITTSVENQYDKQTASFALDDNEQIKEKSQIQVVSFHDTILLIGQAPTEAIRQQAEEIIKKKVDINTIVNRVEIGPPLSSSVKFDDSWVTTKIATQLLMNLYINPRSIKVVTENGVVYLLGNTTKKQAEIATNVAKQTDGVKQVVQLFRYLYYV